MTTPDSDRPTGPEGADDALRAGRSVTSTDIVQAFVGLTRAGDDAIRVVQAWVVDEVDGRVRLQFADDNGTPGLQRYERLAGPPFPVGARVRCLPIGSGYLVLGAAQTAAGEPLLRTEDSGVALQDRTNVLDIGAGLKGTASVSGADRQVVLEVDIGTGTGQIPTAENVQKPLGIRDDGVTEATNPTFVDVIAPLVVAPSGAGVALGLDGSGFATAGHTHDDRYYTESEVDTRIAAARAGAVRGAAVARNTTSSVTTTTLTDLISDTVLTESGRTYDIKMEAGYQVTPSASNVDMVLVINGVTSGMVSAVGSGVKAFVFNTHFQAGVVPGTSFSWAVRFRSSGGASVSVGPGALIVTAIPRA